VFKVLRKKKEYHNHRIIILDKKTISIIRELGVASHLIGTGLTNLRKADFVNHSNFGSSFFNLSIGIERLCKILLIRQYQRKNQGNFPDNAYVRTYSHSIIKLVTEVSIGYNLDYIDKDPLLKDILEFLSVFAKSTRYYNLDSLTKEMPIEEDPYLNWYNIQKKILSRHPNRDDSKESIDSIIKSMNDIVLVQHRELNGESILNLSDFLVKCGYSEKIQSYSVYYFYQIIFDLVKIASAEEKEFYSLPSIDEFFVLFKSEPMKKSEILKKKDWTRVW